MKLLHDNVAIEQDEYDNKTKSGLLLKEQIVTYSPIGTVVAVGDWVDDLKEGDRVVYQPHGGQFVNIDGKELDIVLQGSVLAILK